MPAPSERESRLREYETTLLALLQGGDITPDDAAHARRVRGRLGLADEEARAVHARIFAAALLQRAEEGRIDDAAARNLADLGDCLDDSAGHPCAEITRSEP